MNQKVQEAVLRMRASAMVMLDWFDVLGRRLISIFVYSVRVFLVMYLSLRSVVNDHSQNLRSIFSVVSAQVYFTGWQALPLISTLGLASGSVVIMQSNAQLSMVGGSSMIGNLLVAIIVREIAPLLTALIVIARSGTAVASEVGTMKINREIEALEVMGINPLSFVVFPRLVGGVVSVVALALNFIFVALLGGYVVASFVGELSFSFYFDSLAQAMAGEDVYLFLLKNAFSGAIIFGVSCYQGMQVQKSPHEVPQMTTKAVMNSVIYVVVFNLTVTTLFYLNQLMKLGVL